MANIQTFLLPTGRLVLAYGEQALNRYAIGRCLVGAALSRHLLRGLWCRVCAVGRGDFASIDSGHSHEHSAFHANVTPSRAYDFGYVGAQSWTGVTDQSPACLYLRANRLAISVFETHQEIVTQCCDAWNFFANDIEAVKSIKRRDYAKTVKG